METTIKILSYLINTFGTMYLSVILLRFMCQLSRADFYNPVSQALVKLTNPILVPLRRIIPGLWGIDMASILLAVLFHALVFQIYLLVLGDRFIPPHYLVAWSVFAVLLNIINLYILSGIIVAISSFIAPFSTNPILVLLRQLMEPLAAPFRRWIPPAGGLDFSFLFVFISLTVAGMAIVGIGSSIQTPFRHMIYFSFFTPTV